MIFAVAALVVPPLRDVDATTEDGIVVGRPATAATVKLSTVTLMPVAVAKADAHPAVEVGTLAAIAATTEVEVPAGSVIE